MAELRTDWSVLRGALGTFAICLLIAGILLGTSRHFREAMAVDARLHANQFRDISRKYLAVDEEERIIEAYLPTFRTLREHGVIGPPIGQHVGRLREEASTVRHPGEVVGGGQDVELVMSIGDHLEQTNHH